MVAREWDLGADPAGLEGAARAWRAVASLASAAAQTVGDGARSVVGSRWECEAAEAYDVHQGKLTRDVDVLAEVAEQTATAMDSLAGTLRSVQSQLNELLATLSGIPWSGSPQGTLTFSPTDAEQERRVQEASAAAAQCRALVEEEAALKEAAFAAAAAQLQTLTDRWRPQTVNVVNLNIGSGNDNNRLWGDKDGVSPGEVDELAELLVAENADIATLQEVFRGDLETLERELEERTGDNWEFHFAEASTKVRFTGLGDLFDTGVNEPFGNAVFVREGEAISGSSEVAEHKLDRPGQWFEPPVETGPPTGTTTTTTPGAPPPAAPQPGVPDGEGRAAAHAEVTFTTPD